MVQEVIALGIAVGVMSMTFAWAKVFAEVRQAFFDLRFRYPEDDRKYRKRRFFVVKIGDLVRCPYCVSHWLAFAAVAIYRPAVTNSGFALLDYWVSAMLIIAVSSVVCGIIGQAFK